MNWRSRLEDMSRDELVQLGLEVVAELGRRALRVEEGETNRRRERDRPKGVIGW